MKLENTAENKTRFFAQYWGQEILTWKENTGKLKPVSSWYINDTGCYLLLTPLSQISDEDAVEVKRLVRDTMYWDDGESRNEFDVKYLIRGIIRMINEQTGSWLNVSNISSVIDYLRSRGYALPWMGLSVDQLVEYGWVKLK